MDASTKSIKAVVFDMDGLMFNTEDLYDQVGRVLLSRRNREYSLELKLKMMGLPGPKAFQVMKDECGLSDTVEQLQSETDKIFAGLIPDQIEMLPGLELLLSEIENIGLPKAVATSSHRQFASQALGQFGLIERFEFVLTSEDVENGKPAPDIYLLAAERLNVSAKHMMVLEDSVIGSTAAAASGAITIAVPGSHSQGGDFSHVQHIVERLDSGKVLELVRS